jgi:hypothetical protein
MCDDRLSVDEVDDGQIEVIFCERFSPFAEIRTDFYDEIEKCTTVDAWKTSDENEGGVVTARVYDNGNVVFNNSEYEYCLDVLRAIKNLQK